MPDENTKLRRQSVLIATGCVIGDGVPFLLHAANHSSSHPAVWVAGAAILAADVALALPARTAGPVAIAHAVVRAGVAFLLVVVAGEPDDGIGNATGLAISAYRAGAWIEGLRAWVALGALIAGMALAMGLQGLTTSTPNILATLTNTILPWLLGRHTTGRSGYIQEIRRRAEEQQRDVARRWAVAAEAERGAIARDLHDTISHHVSAVGVHAAAARLSLEPEQLTERATGSLRQVESSSRAAQADLRRMLDLLHGNDSDGIRQPTLAALDGLVEHSRTAGLTVHIRQDGVRPELLPDSLNLAAYRVVQEILTNALRHGDGVLDLTVAQSPDELLLTGTNAFSPSPGRSTGTGRGLDGIRHRVTLFGGSLSLGPDPADPGVWRTGVTLPIQEAP
ncbi:sensor histidine kinase [Lentzea sp. NPDC059081]|uniref:sensor histidine kinase n=1 Tax=Lentzea sp. NPDC059081 TaxID=3346719 RepID=UPI003699FB93